MVKKGEFTLDKLNGVQVLRADLKKAREIWQTVENRDLKDYLDRVLDFAEKMIRQMTQQEEEEK